MIIKSFELNKIEYKEKFFLLYGENQGHKDEIIKNKFKKKYAECTYFYDENQILNNQESFFNENFLLRVSGSKLRYEQSLS